MTTAAEASGTRTIPARRTTMRARNAKYGFAFIAPFIALYLVFVLWPVVQAVWMSFHDWDLLNGNDGFIGLENYVTMLWGENLQWNMTHLLVWRVLLVLAAFAILIPAIMRRRIGGWGIASVLGLVGIAFALGFHPGPNGYWFDPTFWVSLQNTLLFTAVSTPLIAGLGLLMALALQGQRRGTALYQMAFFLPYILPVSVVTLIWAYFLSPNQGLLAELLGFFGIEPIAWLSDPSVAMLAIVMTTTWWTVGFNLVLFAAGLQDVDQSLYEAASLDGAGRWRKFTSVTLPGIQHVLLLVLVMQVIASFQVFGQINIMTGGGPGTSTMVLIKHVYDSGFRDFDLGYASAVSLFLFVLMLIVSLVQMRFLGKDNTK
ncbi:sugar ABC transporter permease [Salinibacterium sp. ZJ77]|uniref:carbohydrate ABC transporter permease n=1 Tax=Salinibacterium sp. ZJ77 TaxID=2708337 RepID=UPI001AB04F4D|nr:sugar ABC transporter permease [Salinibacterium sp. ZJ77]